MRTWLKIIIYCIITITLLLTVLVLFTQTQIFKNWLKNRIVAEANKNLNATLSIGKIQGNLFTHFQISDILLFNTSTHSIALSDGISLPDTILTLPELTINFSPTIGYSKKKLLLNWSPWIRFIFDFVNCRIIRGILNI